MLNINYLINCSNKALVIMSCSNAFKLDRVSRKMVMDEIKVRGIV